MNLCACKPLISYTAAADVGWKNNGKKYEAKGKWCHGWFNSNNNNKTTHKQENKTKQNQQEYLVVVSFGLISFGHSYSAASLSTNV